MAVFYARHGAIVDLVVRLGGFDDNIAQATNNAEYCPASLLGPPAGAWDTLGDMVGDGNGPRSATPSSFRMRRSSSSEVATPTPDRS